MTRPCLESELAEARQLLGRLGERDLVKMLLATPPAGVWSRLLGALIRGELDRRHLVMPLSSSEGLSPPDRLTFLIDRDGRRLTVGDLIARSRAAGRSDDEIRQMLVHYRRLTRSEP